MGETFTHSSIFSTYGMLEGLETSSMGWTCVWSPVCALVELGNLPLCGDHHGLMDPPWQDGVTVIRASSLSRSFVTQPFITL